MTDQEAKQTLSNFRDTFRFLENDFGFVIVAQEIPMDWDKHAILIYKNEFIQLEIAGSLQSYFHVEIRKLHNGYPKPYSDEENNIGFEDLAILESDGNYDHSDYFGYTAENWKKVLLNTANLFKRHKDVFTTNKWTEINKVRGIKEKEQEHFYKKFDITPNSEPSYFDSLKQQAIELLTNNGYNITFDSNELPPYDPRHIFKQIIFTNNKTTIELSIQDWRDCYNIYYIEVDGVRKFEIDLFKEPDILQAVERTMQHLREYAGL